MARTPLFELFRQTTRIALASEREGVPSREATEAMRVSRRTLLKGATVFASSSPSVCSLLPTWMIRMLEQKEADRPPPAPNLTGNVTIAGEEPSTMAYEGNESSLWTISGSTRRVLSTSVPGPSTAFLAFGLVYVDETEYLWRVNFVAHIEDSSALSDFLAEMPSGTTLQTSPPTALPEEWDDYMEDPFAT